MDVNKLSSPFNVKLIEHFEVFLAINTMRHTFEVLSIKLELEYHEYIRDKQASKHSFLFIFINIGKIIVFYLQKNLNFYSNYVAKY